MSESLDRLVNFYQTLTPEGVARFPEFYAEQAWFKDPFNEVRGVAAIQHIFTHMFRQVKDPRFVVTERVESASGANGCNASSSTMLVWEMYYRSGLLGNNEVQVMRGVTHLRFDAEGRVDYHRDYWDAAEELYMKLPAIGLLMRGLRKVIAA
jgi:steroid delta-isomerase